MIKIDINKGIDINIPIAMETTTNILGTLDGFKVFHGEKVNNLIEGYLLSLKRVDNHKEKEENSFLGPPKPTILGYKLGYKCCQF